MFSRKSSYIALRFVYCNTKSFNDGHIVPLRKASFLQIACCYLCCRDVANDADLIEQAVEHFSRMLFLERLRTPQDRQHLLGLYQGCWGHPLPLPSTPELSISPEDIQLGLAKLPRIRAQRHTHAGESVCACSNTPGFVCVSLHCKLVLYWLRLPERLCGLAVLPVCHLSIKLLHNLIPASALHSIHTLTREPPLHGASSKLNLSKFCWRVTLSIDCV